MSTYKIKLEDKAAFINRLDKLGIGVDSYEIKDDKLKGAFEFTVDDPAVDSMVKTVLKQSPKINKIKEMKITKEQLAEIIREELAAAKGGKKKVEENQQLNEMSFTNLIQDPTFLTALGYLVGGGGITAALAKIKKEFGSASEEDKKKMAAHIQKTITGS